MKTHALAFWDFTKKLIFLIGLLTIVAFIKLQVNGDITINPDIFRNTSEIEQINRNLKDFETLQVDNLPETLNHKAK